MPEFRLTQISDTHLARGLRIPTENFDRVCEHIDKRRPDLVINSGDLAHDAPGNRSALEFAKALHDALPVACRYLPGNHDIGDNPNGADPAPSQPVTPREVETFLDICGEDRWRFEAAGWCFIGLNAMLMNTGLASEAEQFDWLAARLAASGGKPVALFLHKPLFLNAPDDPELAASAIRYVPLSPRSRLLKMLAAVDLRLIASGHVHQRRDFTHGRVRHIWAPATGFVIPDRQEVIGIKEVGLVEYRFQPGSFEVLHLRAPGQIDVDLDAVLGPASAS